MEQFSWALKNGGLILMRCFGKDTTVSIPAEVDGYPVTEIGMLAFFDRPELTSVSIPTSVFRIDGKAFCCCDNLTSLTVDPANKTYRDIDGVLFDRSGTLLLYPCGKSSRSYTIPSGVEQIEEYAFIRCKSLTSVSIPASVQSICSNAFYNCGNLTSVTVDPANKAYYDIDGVLFDRSGTLLLYPRGKSEPSYSIPDGITVIEHSAFSGCDKLISVTIPDSVSDIGDYAFSDCSKLSSVTIPDGVPYLGKNTFHGCRSLTSVTIPDSVQSIGSDAFSECENLTSVSIPNRVESIGSSAFYGCRNLLSVTIPDNVQSIGWNAFGRCDRLTSVSVDSANETYREVDGVLFDRSGTLLLYPCGKTEPSYSIPDGIAVIGNYAFCGCRNLTSVSIPDSVERIEEYAFLDCDKLQSVTIPDGVQSIGSEAFGNCASLTFAAIPGSLNSIERNAFNECDHLTSVTVDPANETYRDLDGVLLDRSGTLLLYPGSKSDLSYTIPDGVRRIGEYAFFNCRSLTSVSIPDGVEQIDSNAFFNCRSLTSVTVHPASKAYYDVDGVLFDRSGILLLYPCGKSDPAYSIPDGVTAIGISAFHGCKSLTSVTIPDGVKSIGKFAFAGCRNLTSVTIPDSVKKIGACAFYRAGLKEITVSKSCEIEKGSFKMDQVSIDGEPIRINYR